MSLGRQPKRWRQRRVNRAESWNPQRPATARSHLADATRQFWQKLDRVLADGMDPDVAAGFVVDVIENDRFWIFSHPHVPATALRQTEAMAQDHELIDL
jgi:hypothetical protein